MISGPNCQYRFEVLLKCVSLMLYPVLAHGTIILVITEPAFFIFNAPTLKNMSMVMQLHGGYILPYCR